MSCEVTVRLFHRLRELEGTREVRVTPARCNVSGLIESFLGNRPEAAEEMLDGRGEVSSRYTIVVNQQVITRDRWEETGLANGDEVAFLTLITGG